MSVGGDLATNIIKLTAQSNGRDKIFRTVQYGSKLVGWYLKEKLQDKDITIEKLKKLEASLSMARKLLRFGKSLDFIQGALKTIQHPDTVIRLTVTLSKLAQAVYLIFDHITYANTVGLISVDKKKYSEISARFWLFSLMLNLIRNFYEVWQIILQEIKIQESQVQKGDYMNGESIHKNKTKTTQRGILVLAKKCMVNNKPEMLDLVKNLCDLVLPMSTLGQINTSQGTQGLLGLVSSIIGIVTLWDPLLKLVPS